MWPKPMELTYIPLRHENATCNLASIGRAVIEKKKFETIEFDEWLGQR